MRAIIFANGEFCAPEEPLDLRDDDLIIAADGGSRHLQVLELKPGVLIGDLDSIDKELLGEWGTAGVKIIQYPEDKDQTDLELALIYAQDQKVTEVLVFGAVGGRLDMTLGNLVLLAHPELEVPITLVCGGEEIHLLHPGESLNIQGKPGDTVSLIPLQPGPSVVTTKGLAYALKGEALDFGYTRGISNKLVDHQAQVSLTSGLMALVHIREIQREE
jgi:thiamine pyrophosphokinase